MSKRDGWGWFGLALVIAAVILTAAEADAQCYKDKKFVAVHSAMAAMDAADGLSTRAVLERCPRCTETGWGFSKRPSPLETGWKIGAEFGAITGLDCLVWAKAPKARWASYIVPAIAIGTHSIGLSINLSNLAKIGKRPEWRLP